MADQTAGAHREKRFRIGRHISISPSLLTTPKFADQIGCEIMQIFLGNPQELYSRDRDSDELVSFRSELDKYKMKVVIHGHYTINFCNKPSSQKFKAGVQCLIKDLNSSSIIGKRCLGVIIHMGKNVVIGASKSEAIENYAQGLSECIKQTSDAQIILETGAGTGSEIGTDLKTLKTIYGQLSTSDMERISFCIDTCHIWAAGYDISTSEGVKSYFKDFDNLFGIDKIACIHLNNSQNHLGSKVDRHADLAYGTIKQTGLKEVARLAAAHKIPLIMETPLDVVDPSTNQDIIFADERKLVEKWIRKK